MITPKIRYQILKTLSYRILGSLTTVILSIILGLSVNWAVILGLGELILKPILYFIHERLWDGYKSSNEEISDKIF